MNKNVKNLRLMDTERLLVAVLEQYEAPVAKKLVQLARTEGFFGDQSSLIKKWALGPRLPLFLEKICVMISPKGFNLRLMSHDFKICTGMVLENSTI